MTSLRLTGTSLLTAAALAFLPIKNANATPITYDFTGDTFTNIGNSLLGTSLDATVTVTVPPNYTGLVQPINIDYYTITAIGASPAQTVTYPGSVNFGQTFTLLNGNVDPSNIDLEAKDGDGTLFVVGTGGTEITNPNFGTNYNFATTGMWNQQADVVTNPVPEPSSLTLLGIAVATLPALRFGRRKADASPVVKG